MNIKSRDFGFELKSISDTGTFDGYGSVFGVVDSYDEIVAPGAFADSLAQHQSKGTMPALLWQHRSGEPIGVFKEMREDTHGLIVSGQLAMKTARGAEAFELLKMKAISGLSIGFVPREDSFDQKTGIRTLKKVDLWETSLVTFPANDAARVHGVKNIEQIETIRDAERHLRDTGMSRAEAVAFIARLKRLSQCETDDGMKQISEALKKRDRILA